MVRRRILTTALVIIGGMSLSSCDLFDSVGEALNIFSVEFSEASPAVNGQTIVYSQPSSLRLPALKDFALKMTFHVKADNSKNTGTAAFGSPSVKPELGFYIRSKNKTSPDVRVPVEAFSIPGGTTKTLDFPVSFSLSLIDLDLAKSIVRCDSIPYYIKGSIKFDVLDGSSAVQGSGTADLDLASGDISTCPSDGYMSILRGLL